MKKIILLLIFNLMFAFFWFADAQNFEWVKHIGSEWFEEGQYITSDKLGNIYVVGKFKGTVDFNPGSEVNTLTSSSNVFGTVQDIFILKLNSSGDFQWVKRIGGTSDKGVNAIRINNQGDLLLTGYYSGEMDFDPGPGVQTLPKPIANSSKLFVLNMNSDGSFGWVAGANHVHIFNGVPYIAASSEGYSIAVDSYNNIYVSGDISDGDRDAYVIKLDSLGNTIWDYVFHKNTWKANCIAADKKGNIYTAGLFKETADFNPSDSIFNLDAFGSWDIFVSKYDSSGSFIWAKKLGGFYYDNIKSIALDNNSNVYLTGEFQDIADFNPGEEAYYLEAKNGSKDVFVTKLDSSGSFIWAKQFSGVEDAEVNSMTLDSYGNVFSTGVFEGEFDFDPGDETRNVTSYPFDEENIFFSKLDASGSYVWTMKFEGTGIEEINSVFLDDKNDIYFTGYFNDTVSFDFYNETVNLVSETNSDIFILKMSQTATKVHDTFFDSSVTVYPNPTKDKINIELGKIYLKLNVSVKNISGQEVISEKFNEVSSFQISTNGIIPGVYFLQLTSQDGNSNVLKFIKN